jgi:hypothetical protein
MKSIPLTILDNFFDNPDSIRKFSEELEFFTPDIQFFPGKRTNCLSEIHPPFFNYVNKKVFNLFFENVLDIQYVSNLYFQKIENYEGKGWIHQDPNLFTFMIYFHKPNPEINCGTSIWSLNSNLIHTINNNEEISDSDKRRDHYKTGKVPKFHQEKHHKNFTQEISIPDKYNRLIAFSAEQFHSSNNLNPLKNPRLFLIGFVERINRAHLPVLRSNQTLLRDG